MWDVLVRGALSGVTQLFIKGPLKKIWDLHKIDDIILEIIKGWMDNKFLMVRLKK